MYKCISYIVQMVIVKAFKSLNVFYVLGLETVLCM